MAGVRPPQKEEFPADPLQGHPQRRRGPVLTKTWCPVLSGAIVKGCSAFPKYNIKESPDEKIYYNNYIQPSVFRWPVPAAVPASPAF